MGRNRKYPKQQKMDQGELNTEEWHRPQPKVTLEQVYGIYMYNISLLKQIKFTEIPHYYRLRQIQVMHQTIKNSYQETKRNTNKLFNFIHSGMNKSEEYNQCMAIVKKNVTSNSFQNDSALEEINREKSIMSMRDRTYLKTEILASETQNRYSKKQNEKRNTISAKVNNQTYDQYQTPYIKICQEIELYVTRLFTLPEQYDKIQYDINELVLYETTLKIFKSNSEDEPKRTLLLKHIKSVKYNSNKMYIQFESMPGNNDYLFINFKNHEQLKKWDLALYINKFIQSCLDKQKLFESNELTINTKKPSFAPSSLLSRRKGSHHDTFHLKSLDFENPQSNKINKSQLVRNVLFQKQAKDGKESRQLSEKQSTISKNYQKLKDRTQEMYDKQINNKQIQEKRRFYDSNKDRKQIQQIKWPEDDDSTYQTPNNRIDYNTSFGIVDTGASQFKIFPVQTQKTKATPKNGPLSGQNQLDVSTLTNKTDLMRRVISNLKRPKCFIKCAKGGKHGNSKQVYLSQNQVQLCWKDLKGNQVSKISIEDIQSILLHQKGPGLFKHLPKVSPQNCLVIKAKSRNDIQLYCENRNDIEQFSNDLEILVSRDDVTHND